MDGENRARGRAAGRVGIVPPGHGRVRGCGGGEARQVQVSSGATYALRRRCAGLSRRGFESASVVAVGGAAAGASVRAQAGAAAGRPGTNVAADRAGGGGGRSGRKLASAVLSWLSVGSQDEKEVCEIQRSLSAADREPAASLVIWGPPGSPRRPSLVRTGVRREPPRAGGAWEGQTHQDNTWVPAGWRAAPPAGITGG